MFDIVIIGAGVVGGMLARTLAKYELNICILEKENDVAMGASKANSGIVHAGFDAKPNSSKTFLSSSSKPITSEPLFLYFTPRS